MSHRFWIAAVSLFACAGTAHSQSITYDFKGIGQVCTAAQPDADFVCDPDAQFTGSVTMDVLAQAPGGSDGETDGVSFARDDNGFVQNSFVIRWGNESFTPGPVPQMQRSESFTEVDNDFTLLPGDPPIDRLWNGVLFSGGDCQMQADLVRSTPDTSWLGGLNFNLSARLAPGTDALNILSFDTIACDASFYHRYAFLQLTSLTPHARRVGIDIRPHADPNFINPKSEGFVTVAVLGSTDFDATQVDPRFTRFGPSRAEPVGDIRISDVNRDGGRRAALSNPRYRNLRASADCGAGG